MAGLLEEESSVVFILGWTPSGRATASSTALLGPWLDLSWRLSDIIRPRLAGAS
jgi:hypothetical protein